MEERYIGGREEDPYGVAAPETANNDHHVVMASVNCRLRALRATDAMDGSSLEREKRNDRRLASVS
jgi:hypothetical protein